VRPCHFAIDSPWREGAGGTFGATNCSSRVWRPASLSIFSVASSAHVMWNRDGTRIRLGAPYALHLSAAASSFATSHESASFLPAGFSGMLTVSPFGAVTMRKRQSSWATDTHQPVMSRRCFCFGVPGGSGGGELRRHGGDGDEQERAGLKACSYGWGRPSIQIVRSVRSRTGARGTGIQAA
jgi:hypothetical protein